MAAFDPFAPMASEARYAALGALRRKAPLARIAAGPWLAASMSYVARMETRVVLETLLARIEKLALAPGYAFDPNPVFWALGPRTLRLTLS